MKLRCAQKQLEYNWHSSSFLPLARKAVIFWWQSHGVKQDRATRWKGTQPRGDRKPREDEADDTLQTVETHRPPYRLRGRPTVVRLWGNRLLMKYGWWFIVKLLGIVWQNGWGWFVRHSPNRSTFFLLRLEKWKPKGWWFSNAERRTENTKEENLEEPPQTTTTKQQHLNVSLYLK